MWLLAGFVAATVLIALIGLVAVRSTARGFAKRTDGLKQLLIASQSQANDAAPVLPDIVRSYAVKAGGREGASTVFHARHRATLQTAKGARPIDIEADQWTGILVPGIVWTARGRMSGLPVSVFDAFVEGHGELSARVLGAFQVAGGSGADYDKGELMRYLSELPVYPDAILNLRGVDWRQIDDATVSVTARSATGEATVRFYFDPSGDIVRMEADDRPMETRGTTVHIPWHGVYSRYAQFGRHRIPSYGEVGWVLPDGLFVYWRGEVISYDPGGGEP
ncbi:hypothetical protein SAMN02983003_2076 [Devosia enhydra]|uniref:Uncharacterized protein n=1 Tax=Devosia enhydra TaxID=665118 RepID=A0A1K2HXR0_9HYPH|nr:hypothetical protein SAMN02983003_2076 [Devosia enhydra]